MIVCALDCLNCSFWPILSEVILGSEPAHRRESDLLARFCFKCGCERCNFERSAFERALDSLQASGGPAEGAPQPYKAEGRIKAADDSAFADGGRVPSCAVHCCKVPWQCSSAAKCRFAANAVLSCSILSNSLPQGLEKKRKGMCMPFPRPYLPGSCRQWPRPGCPARVSLVT